MKEFSYDSIYDMEYDDRTKYFFSCSMVSTCPKHFGHLDSNYEVERILRMHRVIRANNNTDSETCALVLYFSSKKAGQNFIDRLNKFLCEYRLVESRQYKKASA